MFSAAKRLTLAVHVKSYPIKEKYEHTRLLPVYSKAYRNEHEKIECNYSK
jgi:hypothetical protein